MGDSDPRRACCLSSWSKVYRSPAELATDSPPKCRKGASPNIYGRDVAVCTVLVKAPASRIVTYHYWPTAGAVG
jgi:hypothetical protein